MKLHFIFHIHLREIFYVYFNSWGSSGFGVSFMLDTLTEKVKIEPLSSLDDSICLKNYGVGYEPELVVKGNAMIPGFEAWTSVTTQA